MIKIPSTKSAPEDIVPFLKILDSNFGNVEKMQDEIHRYLLDKSKRVSRDKENSFYAIAIPVLNRLELIKGHGDDFEITKEGKILVQQMDVNEEKGKKIFAQIILRIDDEKAQVVKVLQQINSKHVDLETLVEKLKEMGTDTHNKDSRLLTWLTLLNYSQIIRYKNQTIQFNKEQVKGLKKDPNVSLEEFEKVLYTSYDLLKKKARGSVYISIPELQDSVVEQLGEKGLTSFHFRDYLLRLLKKENTTKKIMFSRPGSRQEGGIKIKNTYYYFISLYDKK